MSKSVTDLRAIAASGGGMILNAEQFSTTDLRAIAASGNKTGARITLKNIGSRSTTDLRAIAASGGGASSLTLRRRVHSPRRANQ